MQACQFRNRLLSELRARFQFGEQDDEKPFNILFIANNNSDESVGLKPRQPRWTARSYWAIACG